MSLSSRHGYPVASDNLPHTLYIHPNAHLAAVDMDEGCNPKNQRAVNGVAAILQWVQRVYRTAVLAGRFLSCLAMDSKQHLAAVGA